MILPSKHLAQNRAIIGVGAKILTHLKEPISVSELWNRMRTGQTLSLSESSLSYDWFVLSLSFLYAITAIEIVDGVLFAPRKVK